MLRWLWLAAAVLVLDQAAKLAAERWIAPRAPIEVLPFLDLVFTYNTGAAFSFLADAGGWQRWLFLALALGVSVGLTLWLRRLRRDERLAAAGIALVVGGALGNAVDRIARPGVADFIDLHCCGWHWPAFNLADSALTLGVAALLWSAWRQPERP